jgi:acyl carrier protein
MPAPTLDRLTAVFHEVFEDDSLVLSRSTSAADIEGWDSMMHVTLMLQVEATFGIRLSSGEVTGLKNVGQLIDLIDARAAR